MRGIWGTVALLRRPPDQAVLRGVVVAVAVVQAGVLGLLARRGYWLSDDLDFLVQGSRGFAPRELLTPVNDHIAPGLRFVYAGFAELAPLNWDVTIAWRMIMQALAITLMGLLLLRLLGSSWWVVTGTLLYALTPLSMPSFMSLSSGVNNLPAHVFGLLLLHATLDWYSGRRLRAIAYGPLSLLISLACWEKSALILVTVVALALYRRTEPLGPWVRRTLPYAAALLMPVVAFGIVYLQHGNPSAGRLPEPRQLLDLAGRAFAVPLGALVGGPWEWNAFGTPMGLATPPAAASVLGGLVAAFLLLTAWRRDRRALLLWGSVVVYVLVTLLLVSYGRFRLFGGIFTAHYHYWSDLSIPLTLAVVLTATSIRPRIVLARFVPVAALCCLVAWFAGTVVTATGFAEQWAKNPAKPYFATVRGELDRYGPTANLWDTTMPPTIVSLLSPDIRLSSVLRLTGIPFQSQAPGSEPSIVDDTGRFRPATLTVWSQAEPPKTGNTICDLLVRGTEPVTLPLRSTPTEAATGNWYAEISYFSNRENHLVVELLDDNGSVAAMPAVTWPAALPGDMYFGPSDHIRATAVRLRSTDPGTNLCLGHIEVGLPEVSR